MDFYAVLDQVVALLRSRGRVSYRALKRQFALDDELLADLTAELRYAHYPIEEDHDQGLVWTGETAPPSEHTPPPPRPETAHAPPPTGHRPNRVHQRPNAASSRCCSVTWWTRRCWPASSTRKSGARWCGPIKAPAPRLFSAMTGILRNISAMVCWSTLAIPGRTKMTPSGRCGLGSGWWKPSGNSIRVSKARQRGVSLAVRLGIHTGQVVVGEIGGGATHEQLALGETPNLAARLQGIAAPNTLVISAATLPLLGGFFTCQSLGTQLLKGFAQPHRSLSGTV